jgi:hypothetical protein
LQGTTGAASTVAGPQGSTGAASTVAGPQGATGAQGFQGATGTGAQGPQGTAGSLNAVAKAGDTMTGTLTINKNSGGGLILNRDAVTNYNGIYYATATTNKWFIGMRENLSSNNHIHYSEQIAQDVLTLNVANGNAAIYGNLTIGNSAEVMGLIQMGASGRYGMGISAAYTNVHAHNSGNGVRLGYYDGTTFTARMTIPNGGAPLIDANAILHAGNYNSYALPLSGGVMTGSIVNNTDGAVIIESNATENNNWLWKENAKQWGLFWFNRGSQSGQTIGGYSTIGAELMFMGAGIAGIDMPSGWTGYIAGSKIAAMISNYNGYIYSASTVYAATSMVVGGNTVWHAGNLTNNNQLTNGAGYITSSSSISGNAATATNVAWSGVTSKPAGWLDTTNLIIDNVPGSTVNLVPSGFYQNYNGDGNPTGTWFNYINVRHSNPGNGHGFQIGMTYYDSNLWFRSYSGSGSSNGWSRALATATDTYPSNMNQYVRTTDDVTHSILRASSYVVTPTIYSGGGSITFGNNVGNFYVAPTSASWAEGISFTMPSTSTWGGLRWRRERAGYDGNWAVGYTALDSSDDLVFVANNNGAQVNNILRLTKAGNVSTQGSFTASGDVTAYSDARVKENIFTIDNALEKTLQLRGVYYNRTDKEDKSQKIGVIAQEIQQILPQVVQEQPDGMLSVAYGNIVGVLIEAIKELKTENDTLKEILQRNNII